MKRAERRPASGLFVHSLVKKYVEIDVRPAKTGARNTQTLRISIGNERKSAIHLIDADVTIIPGKIVPPITLPKGYHDSLSNQFQN